MLSVYIAMSLDGFIASADHSVSFLDQFNELIISKPQSYFATSYDNYYKTVDQIVLGSKTYDAILGFDIPYPYAQKQTYVITKQTYKQNNMLTTLALDAFTSLNLPGKTWVVGGGQLISTLLAANLIDELIITIMPVILGDGIRLFPTNPTMAPANFTLIDTKMATGLVELTYIRPCK
ncbi:MAG: dihydrofolate reductase family protein [Culicoidibacterales bacterium]